MNTREPLLRASKLTSERIINHHSLNHHSIGMRGRWVLCNCLKRVRDQDRMGELRRNARKYLTWPSRFKSFKR